MVVSSVVPELLTETEPDGADADIDGSWPSGLSVSHSHCTDASVIVSAANTEAIGKDVFEGFLARFDMVVSSQEATCVPRSSTGSSVAREVRIPKRAGETPT